VRKKEKEILVKGKTKIFTAYLKRSSTLKSQRTNGKMRNGRKRRIK